MNNRKILSLFSAAAAAFLWAAGAGAAPFAETFRFIQPDGTAIELWGEGDEFYAVFETLDGYTVVFDHARKAYVYAVPAADGERLAPSGLLVGRDDPAAQGLEKHLRMSREAIREQAQARFKVWDEATQNSAQWQQRKAELRAMESAAADGPVLLSPPSFTTTGIKVGLCLLIDFSDDTGTVSQASINDFCNGDSYTGFGNNGSVKKYYQDNSNNLLTYSNIVTVYIRMVQPKSYYNDTSKDAGYQANYLIRDAVALMKTLPNYASEIAPAFSNLTRDASNRAVACNVFYAGGNGGVWSYGLWPHSWSLYVVGQQEIVTGVYLYKYEVTNIGTSLTLGTFCHENGHMLCGFPDIYDYEYDSYGGAGSFCLMDYGGSGGNPVQLCAYLKRAAGWTTTLELTSASALTASLSSAGDGFNSFYRYVKPGVSTEYYLLENRQKKGRDLSLPAAGIAVWHVDEKGNKDNQSLAYNTAHANYEATLVQADNKWQFQKYTSSGDTNDLFYSGNKAAGYLNRFNDTDEPRARWWDGAVSGISFSAFSVNDTNMTFSVAPEGVAVVTTSPLATGFVGVPYSKVLAATNGAAPYTWAVVSNALPAGLALSADGVLSGTPGAETNIAFRIAATDSGGLCVTNLMTVTTYAPKPVPFAEPFENSTQMPSCWTQEYLNGTKDWSPRAGGYSSNPSAAHGGSYNAWLFISSYNSSNPRKTKLVSPMLDFGASPANAQLIFWHCMKVRSSSNADALRVYYKTGETNTWTLLATYTSEVPVWTRQTLSLPNPNRTYFVAFEGAVNYGYGVCVDDVMAVSSTSAPLITTPAALASEYIGNAYTQALEAVGGTLPYTWAMASNALPAGLTLSSGGVISGVPDLATNLSFRVRVTGGNGLVSTNLCSLSIITRKSVPYVETFENGGKIPADWTQVYVTGTRAWGYTNGGYNRQYPSSAHGGSYNALLYSNVLGRTTKLITPALDFGLVPQNAQLTFWHCMKARSGGYQDALRVYCRTGATNAWLLLASYTNEVPVWTKRLLALPAPNRTYYLAFEGVANYGYGVCVDDIAVDPVAPYVAWKTACFTVEELDAGVITGDPDDPDGDGIANLLEYALGLNPKLSDTAGVPFGGVWSQYLMLSYRQNKQATDIAFTVESCTNLLDGLWSTNGVAEVLRADSNQWWQVTSRHNVPVTNAPSRFLRLKVSLP